jgi:hypothetical protein
VTLLPFAVVEAGRHSAKNICLRLEPTDDAANLEKSRNISSHHLTIRYLGDGVELVDPGSVNGTFIGKEKLAANQPHKVEPGMVVSVAEVLDLEFQPMMRKDAPEDKDGICKKAEANRNDAAWLQSHLIGVDKPGRIDFLRIRRRDNQPEQEYVLLFHSGLIGSEADALIRLEPSERTPRRRVYDVGGDASLGGARLFVQDGRILIERRGSEPVALAGEPLKIAQPRPIVTPGELIVGSTTFRFEP